MTDEPIGFDFVGWFNRNRNLIFIVLGLVICGYISVFILGKDNPIEKEIEQVIELETGVPIKLTP